MKHHCTLIQIALACVVIIFLAQTFSYAQVQNGNFMFEGINRSYKVFLPQNVQPDMPLVFNLPGYMSYAQWQMDYSHMNDVADTAGFIVVYPNAVYPGFNSGLIGYPGFPPLPNSNDVGFISALIDTLEARYDIDMNRVYSCGLSNGGIMSYRLACELGSRFAAVASVAGVLTDNSGTSGSPPPTIPILQIHGTADEVVPYEGGIANLWSVDSTLSFWAQNNNCLLPPDTILLPDLDPNDGCTVQQISFATGSDAGEIVLYRVIDGGHSWPGAAWDTSVDLTNRDIDASVEIWKFFKAHELMTSTGVRTSHSPGESSLVQNYPNPFNPTTTISFALLERARAALSIYDVEGRVVRTLVDEAVGEGYQERIWDGKDARGNQVGSGVYFYRLTAGNRTLTKKMVLLR